MIHIFSKNAQKFNIFYSMPPQFFTKLLGNKPRTSTIQSESISTPLPEVATDPGSTPAGFSVFLRTQIWSQKFVKNPESLLFSAAARVYVVFINVIG